MKSESKRHVTPKQTVSDTSMLYPSRPRQCEKGGRCEWLTSLRLLNSDIPFWLVLGKYCLRTSIATKEVA
eukprot:5817022-Amphidinium_carterae.1